MVLLSGYIIPTQLSHSVLSIFLIASSFYLSIMVGYQDHIIYINIIFRNIFERVIMFIHYYNWLLNVCSKIKQIFSKDIKHKNINRQEY